ncbi:MAG TPA: PTS glucitol/sorbitol transporter subunit IIA [Mycobacteriales bacterium]|nr:PTS glucitol/sorbitol transporter subunit IIA [Mycobacteriales bacterium]
MADTDCPAPLGAAGQPAVRYSTVVTAVGALVPDFVAQGVLVWFAEGAPEELHEFSVLHRPTVVGGGVAPGDEVRLDDAVLRVLAVGPVANDNLVNLGHLDLKASGETSAPLPGDVCVERVPLPAVRPGSRLTIVAGMPATGDMAAGAPATNEDVAGMPATGGEGP